MTRRKAKPTKRGKPTVRKSKATPSPTTERAVRFPATKETHAAIPNEMMSHLANRVATIMRGPGKDRPTESELDFGLAAIAGLKPKTTSEVLLCTQMAAVHEVFLEMLTRAKLTDGLAQMQETGTLAVKLGNLFQAQFQTLAKSRQPKQIVEVRHEHRHVHAHASATPGDGATEILEGQVYAPTDPRALAVAGSPALLGEDAPRATVPSAADEARPMPAARRRVRDRSAKR